MPAIQAQKAVLPGRKVFPLLLWPINEDLKLIYQLA